MYFFWEYSQGQVGSSGRKNRRSMEVMEVGEVVRVISRRGELRGIRPCAYCGLGLRASPFELKPCTCKRSYMLFCGSRLHPEPEWEMREQNKPLPIKKELLMLDRQIHPSPSRFESLRIFAVARAEVYPSMYSSLL